MTLGEYKLHSQVEPLPPQTYHVVRAVVHPNFKFSPAADRFDVAVLRLDRPVQVKFFREPFWKTTNFESNTFLLFYTRKKVQGD